MQWVDGPDLDAPPETEEERHLHEERQWQRMQTWQHIMRHSGFRRW